MMLRPLKANSSLVEVLSQVSDPNDQGDDRTEQQGGSIVAHLRGIWVKSWLLNGLYLGRGIESSQWVHIYACKLKHRIASWLKYLI